MIYDGSGGAPIEGSVLVRDDRVAAFGRDLEAASATEVVDATGLAIAPGIIDMHTHSDVSLLSDPACVSAIGQGVTTQVVGHCGFSAAPTNERTRRTLIQEEPIFGFPPGGHPGPWGWDTITEYLEAVRSTAPSTNVATLVGHNTIRRTVLGSDDRRMGPKETAAVKKTVLAAISQGAVGVSTGLSYAPGVFARAAELEALASAAREQGRGYHTHMRYGDHTARESLAEAIDTARSSGASVNVSHLYPGMDDPIDEASRFLSMVDTARSRGLDVTFDLTLFRRGGGAWVQRLPSWARKGGAAAMIANIRRPETRKRLLEVVRRRDDWDDQLIVKTNQDHGSVLVGRTIGEIARERGDDPAETALSLVEEDSQFWVAPTIKRQEDLDLLLSHPSCVPVTDGMASHPVRHASLGLMPKTFGTFALLLGEYVRDRRVLPLAEAIARVTSLPADRMGLTGRGRITKGAFADLLLFDPTTIANTATDARPGNPPTGISHVMVNGRWAMRGGKTQGSRSGRVVT